MSAVWQDLMLLWVGFGLLGHLVELGFLGQFFCHIVWLSYAYSSSSLTFLIALSTPSSDVVLLTSAHGWLSSLDGAGLGVWYLG